MDSPEKIIVESSPPPSSPPLTKAPGGSLVAQVLREKFTYRPTSSSSPPPVGESANDSVSQKDADLATLHSKFPSLSTHLVSVVFKVLEYDLARTTQRCQEILDKRTVSPVRNEIKKPVPQRPSSAGSSSRLASLSGAGRAIPLFTKEQPPVSPEKTSSRVTVDKQATMFNRYSHARREQQQHDTAIKRRRLVRGSDRESSAKVVDIASEEEDAAETDEEVEQSSEPEEDFDQKVLQFLNTANVQDVADICGLTVAKAEQIVNKRPYQSEDSFYGFVFDDSKRRGKSDGERIWEKTEETLRGYEAIQSLIKKCSYYGDVIAKQMSKWGVDMEASELDVIDVEVDDDDVEEEDDAPVVRKKRVVRVDSDEEDEEYGKIVSIREIKREAKNVKYFKKKPKLLSPDLHLKDYQQTGINWINLLYQNKLSCILADEMGLGKTCQVISFLAHLKQTEGAGPHLVVVPSSTLENWLREFNKFAPSLVVEPYYGSQSEREEMRDVLEDSEYDVLITTYNLASGNKYDMSFLRSRGFDVIVYDEGHMLKNSMSERFQKLMKLRAKFRLLLTGTPLQNNLKELISLLEFILPDLFVSKKEDLKHVFRQKATTQDEYNPLLAQEAISRARTMMKPFILRRKKDQVLKHLPAKEVSVDYCTLTKSQRAIYQKCVSDALRDKEQRSQGVSTKQTNVIMQLRKAALHPLLFRSIYNDDAIDRMSEAILNEPAYAVDGNKQYIKEDMSYMSDYELHKLCEKFPNTLSKFLLDDSEWMNSGKVTKLIEHIEGVRSRGEKVLVFSLFTQMLDILEHVFSLMNIKFLRLDGSTQVNERQALIDTFYDDNTIPVFILSTRAGGFGINLVCANNVIIYDQSFNPHDDKQAADRAHRVGQQQKVNVVTLIARDSIEENIHQVAKNKLDLDSKMEDDDTIEKNMNSMLEDIIYK